MAANRGKQETEKLQKNIEDQLNRLLSQLEDLEELKADLAEDEYQGFCVCFVVKNNSNNRNIFSLLSVYQHPLFFALV
jgi:hypothetical protein